MKLKVLIAIFLAGTTGMFAQCSLSSIVAENKVKIPSPYKYDGFTMTSILFNESPHTFNTEFMAFKGQKYKLIFCSSGFEEAVTIAVALKSDPSKKISETVLGADQQSFLYEPAAVGTYLISISASPSSTGVEHKECVVMLIGFSDK